MFRLGSLRPHVGALYLLRVVQLGIGSLVSSMFQERDQYWLLLLILDWLVLCPRGFTQGAIRWFVPQEVGRPVRRVRSRALALGRYVVQDMSWCLITGHLVPAEVIGPLVTV